MEVSALIESIESLEIFHDVELSPRIRSVCMTELHRSRRTLVEGKFEGVGKYALTDGEMNQHTSEHPLLFTYNWPIKAPKNKGKQGN